MKHIHTLKGMTPSDLNGSMPYSCVTLSKTYIPYTVFHPAVGKVVLCFPKIFSHHCLWLMWSTINIVISMHMPKTNCSSYCTIDILLTYRRALWSNSSTRSDGTNMALKRNFNIELYFLLYFWFFILISAEMPTRPNKDISFSLSLLKEEHHALSHVITSIMGISSAYSKQQNSSFNAKL